MRRCLFIFCCALALTIVIVPAPTSAAETTAPLSLIWRLIENQPDGHFKAELVVQNDRQEPLVGDWSLYFNSDRRLLPESDSQPFVLEHVNGDLYRLRPTDPAQRWQAGEMRTLQSTGAPWAINVSDAPSGFYLISTDAAGKEQPPVSLPIQIASFPAAASIVRGGDDQLPVVTAASRFAENERLELLQQDQLPKVIPTPVRTTALKGRVTINATTTIVYDPKLAAEAKFLASSLQPLLNASLAMSDQAKNDNNTIHLRLSSSPPNSEAPQSKDNEAYTLSARQGAGIEIVGTSPAGVFYGIQSLRAILPVMAYARPAKELAVDAVEIEDAPRFAYRGLLLDVGRNFQSKETVKKLLDLMAFYKLNRFHFHLTDDEGWRVEIKAFPELTAVGSRRGHTADETTCLLPSLGSGPFPDPARSAGSGFYSQDDFVDILQYANERHIKVIPEIDVPGHSRAAVISMAARAHNLRDQNLNQAADDVLLTDPDDKSQYESVQMWRGNVLDVGRESTYRFLDVVVGELSDLYRRAGAPLTTIHLGGDEVPEGAWLASPACQNLTTDEALGISRGQQLQLHFLDRACELVAKHDLQPACWEDCLLFGAKGGPTIAETRANAAGVKPIVYVWNNVWGWGREDAAYRLANAGYDVVLSNATNLYFDLAQEKEPHEPGYYWAGFVGARDPFEFNPFDVFQNASHDLMGHAMAAEQFPDRVRLTAAGQQHILGIQGQLWGENLRDPKRVEYMAFPRTIALAERAWSPPSAWSAIDDPAGRDTDRDRAWNRFANCLGQRELVRLDRLNGGVAYRIPPPGVAVRDGQIAANTAYPGLVIRYTTDGTEPSADAARYDQPIRSDQDVQLRAFDSRGRGSRTEIVSRASPQ